MAGHSSGGERGLFCSLRMDKCPCGNKYKDIMEGTESWGKYIQKYGVTVRPRSPEAHHVLPVASVTANITANEDISDEVVKNTKWCVNDKLNMIALPLFEMTFAHYLIEYGIDSSKPISAPPFASLPMHNYGHAAFQKDVNRDLGEIRDNAVDNTKNHEEVSKELRDALNSRRTKLMSILNARGKRKNGTHVEFLNAMGLNEDGTKFSGDNQDTWDIPFSMARKVRGKAFPSAARKSGLSKKFNSLVKAMSDFSSAT